MEISVVCAEELGELVTLFDEYRIFYKQPSDIDAARKFLEQRLHNKESVLLAARENDNIVGFIQLYPSFSSIAMKQIWILNDLFVKSAFRKRGIAKSLMNFAVKHAQNTGGVRIILSTQVSNLPAQTLYESLGYSKNKDFYHYALHLE